MNNKVANKRTRIQLQALNLCLLLYKNKFKKLGRYMKPTSRAKKIITTKMHEKENCNNKNRIEY